MNSADQIPGPRTPESVELSWPRSAVDRTAALPLPGGEGRGEGERPCQPGSSPPRRRGAVSGVLNPESPPPASEAETHPTQPTTACAHRGNGNVARLPQSVRDQINHWMLDGVPYADIIGRLGEQGQHLKPDHLYQWKKRGHQDWLVQ